MPNQEHLILSGLAGAEGPLCHDCLAHAAGVAGGETAQICTSLAFREVISRRQGVCSSCGVIKLVSQAIPGVTAASAENTASAAVNFKASIEQFLTGKGYTLANAEEKGPCLIGAVSPEGRRLQVAILEKPDEKNTARSIFAAALLDLMLAYGEDTGADYALAMPKDSQAYIDLLHGLSRLQKTVKLTVMRPDDNGAIAWE